eukprot:Blabericola_migrator_1__1431@NODE_1376_length_4690_cov_315_853126_g357_i1_p2_GENE_NODE_1376_length_4690_cov_315_853126_g357_i1NODE_1376_length_4690_cov_315_853126_g357_i1_p2_ORF_typecomplete_len281_score36_65_NODE_1376_length_4690_cov_315_853126_g357_i123303172
MKALTAVWFILQTEALWSTNPIKSEGCPGVCASDLLTDVSKVTSCLAELATKSTEGCKLAVSLTTDDRSELCTKVATIAETQYGYINTNLLVDAEIASLAPFAILEQSEDTRLASIQTAFLPNEDVHVSVVPTLVTTDVPTNENFCNTDKSAVNDLQGSHEFNSTQVSVMFQSFEDVVLAGTLEEAEALKNGAKVILIAVNFEESSDDLTADILAALSPTMKPEVGAHAQTDTSNEASNETSSDASGNASSSGSSRYLIAGLPMLTLWFNVSVIAFFVFV